LYAILVGPGKDSFKPDTTLENDLMNSQHVLQTAVTNNNFTRISKGLYFLNQKHNWKNSYFRLSQILHRAGSFWWK